MGKNSHKMFVKWFILWFTAFCVSLADPVEIAKQMSPGNSDEFPIFCKIIVIGVRLNFV